MYTSVLLPAFFSNADTLYKRENNRPNFLDGICCCSILLLFSMQKMPSSTWNNLLLWRYCHKCVAPSVPSQKRRNNFSNNVIGVDRGKLMRLLSFARRRWQIQGVCVKYNCGCFFGTPCETMAAFSCDIKLCRQWLLRAFLLQMPEDHRQRYFLAERSLCMIFTILLTILCNTSFLPFYTPKIEIDLKTRNLSILVDGQCKMLLTNFLNSKLGTDIL